MCSTPKGGTTRPLISSSVDSMSGDMSSTEYSDMVHRANESYERRQEELIEYRKTHKRKLMASCKNQSKNSLYEKMKTFLGQMIKNEALESKKSNFF